MKINSYILADELKGVEKSILKSALLEFFLTGAVIWQQGLPVREYYVYIMQAEELEELPKGHPSLTIVCIGEPKDQPSVCVGADILFVKKYLTPEMLLSMLLKIFEKYRNFESALDKFCREGESFSRLSPVLLSVFDNPILILGQHMEILAAAQDGDECRIPCEYRKDETDFLLPVFEDAFRTALQEPDKASFVTESGIPFLAEAVMDEEEMVMGIFLLSVTVPFTAKDRILLWVTGEYLKRLRRVNFTNRYQGMERMQQALSLWTGQGENRLSVRECMSEALARLSWEERDTYICIVLKSAFMGQVRKADIPDYEIFSSYSMIVASGKDIFFICNLTRLPYGMEKIETDLEHRLENSPLFGGISTPFRSFFDYPDYGTQAQAAIRIGSKMDYTRRVSLFRDCALDYIIYEGWKSLPMNILLFGGLKDLLLHDYIHHTGYYRTLEALFENYMVMSRTASSLGIHISTLKYRVKRISEMLGLDLNNTYNKMYLQSILFLLKQDTEALETYLEQESRKRLGSGHFKKTKTNRRR